MRIPKFIKQLAKFADSTSARYALGGVYCEHKDGVSAVTATDGRFLASVSYVDAEAASADAVVNAKELVKAVTATAVAAKSRTALGLEVDGDRATVHGNGQATASIVDGRFPRYRDVFADKDGEYACVKLDPKMLKIVAELYSACVSVNDKGVDIWVPLDSTKPTFFAHTTEAGEVVRAIQMPLEANRATPAEFPPAAGSTVDTDTAEEAEAEVAAEQEAAEAPQASTTPAVHASDDVPAANRGAIPAPRPCDRDEPAMALASTAASVDLNADAFSLPPLA